MRRLIMMGLLALAVGGPLAGCVVRETVVARPAQPCDRGVWVTGQYDRNGNWHPAHWRCPTRTIDVY